MFAVRPKGTTARLDFNYPRIGNKIASTQTKDGNFTKFRTRVAAEAAVDYANNIDPVMYGYEVEELPS